ncbi:Short-chain dehydrogenase/reductase family protein [Mycena sanguinolenta]|uniref:Short-chain dehydrogenase/reductase family protein n=1 Tax=Mycena sanguinolenta TaxID=230812 RepID=A0A8H6YCI0_9AGAR|nr:Short-chain dehydrogenase/reductase family protein [Mycena sanguinolenta]
MILFRLFFSPHARVWNLRLLLLVTLTAIAFLITTIPSAAQERYSSPTIYMPWAILLPTLCCIVIHHAAFVIHWPIPSLAVIDLILLFFELCGLAAGFVFVDLPESLWTGTFPTLLKFACVPLGLPLILSMIFRIATIVRSDGRFFRQEFVFLGACSRPNPPYTPAAILLNRSVARPLVRGESVIIIFARALILSCIAVGIPVFGIYAMVINPIHASVYTRSVAKFATADLGSPPGNVTFLMSYFGFDGSAAFSTDDFSVNHVVVSNLTTQVDCVVTFEVAQVERLVECPSAPWTSLDRWSSISINLTIPAGVVVTVTPLPTKPAILDSVHLQVPTEPIPVVSGSHLFGRLIWTQRKTESRWIFGIPVVFASVFTAEVTGLQLYPAVSSTTTNNEATLLLYQPYVLATRLQQDSSDITSLSGLSTFGGFWTFVNGVFVLFFGANVVYFAFGRRPLSALGLIHIFQRRALVRRWHTDFPTLRTEGGQPGSEDAGVVAFIRERLIDINDEDAQVTNKNDLRAQRSRSNSGSEEDLIEVSTNGTGYADGTQELSLVFEKD